MCILYNIVWCELKGRSFEPTAGQSVSDEWFVIDV